MMKQKHLFKQTISSTNPCAYCAIVKLLEKHGFAQQPNGDMFRRMTGCSFEYKSLIKYASLLAFQLEWPYA